MSAGTAVRLLCLPLCIGLLASCTGRGHSDATSRAQFEEMQADIQGVMKNSATHTGAPVHVDPYVHSAGMSHEPHNAGDKKGC
jgi:hypothetical protein